MLSKINRSLPDFSPAERQVAEWIVTHPKEAVEATLAHVADACHKFFRLGIPCSTLMDTPMILQFAAIAEPADVLVLLSHTGRWPGFSR